MIITAALSVQDPRERPIEAQDAADTAHRRFADERSDFMAQLKLWAHVNERIEHKKSNRKLTEDLKSQFLSPRRIREWIDVHSQLAAQAGEHRWRINPLPASFEQIHQALLTGLLGNIGTRVLDADRGEPPFAGARGIKFHIWPGSALAKKAGRWIVAAELVETSRLFARTVATIDAAWLERIGQHLLKKSHSDPHWEKKAGRVIAFERATLYGLVVYAQRRVAYEPIDPVVAREVFIREALVGGELESRAPFYAHNLKLVRDIRQLEHRARRLDVLVDDELIVAFYDRVIPPDVTTAAQFDSWRQQIERTQPRLLFLERDELMRHEAAGVTTQVFPAQIDLRGNAGSPLPLALTYHFEPGSPRDGVTATVPLIALNQIDPARAEWLVPGMLKEKVQLLLKSLPQKVRRHCVPLPQYAAGFADRAGADEGEQRSLIDALIDDLRTERSLMVQAPDFKLETLPAHLSMNFKVVDEHGRQLAMGRNLAHLRSELGAAAQQTFQAVATQGGTLVDGLPATMTDWDFDRLPELLEVRRDGRSLVGFPALVDGSTQVSIEIFDDAERAAQTHRAGLRRLFRLQLREQVRFIEKGLGALQTTQMQAASVAALAPAFRNFSELSAQIIDAAIDRTCLIDPMPSDRSSFHARRENARSKLSLIAQEIARLVTTVVAEAALIGRKLGGLKVHAAAVADIEAQLQRLFAPGFIIDVPAASLAHYPRYLKAIAARLDKLKDDPVRDAMRMKEVQALQVPFLRELAARKGMADPRLEEFRWLLEELRVSLFAQELRTPMPVSSKRLQKVWDSTRR